ncbi:MAG: heavy metal-binding domain-containing protein [Saprospiraceae bacterium]
MTIYRFLVPGFMAFSLLVLAACGNGGTDGAATEPEATETTAEPAAADMSGPEYTSAYVCPMHCEGSGAAEPGTCPVCGMEYVASAELNKSGDDAHEHDHGHDHDHDGHDHEH